jgi:Ser/Thr protein kinase RdoA (MazF antagonist)
MPVAERRSVIPQRRVMPVLDCPRSARRQQWRGMRSPDIRELSRVCHEDYGLRLNSLTPIKERPNATFHIRSADGEFLLRVHDATRRTTEQLLAEMRLLDHLAANLPAQRPRRGRTGILTRLPRAPWASVAVLTWFDGRILSSGERDPDHYGHLGRLLGRFHAASAMWPEARLLPRPGVGMAGVNSALTVGNLSPDVARELAEAVARIAPVEETLTSNPTLCGLIHGDPSFGNVVFRHDGEPVLIDFDDCGHGIFAYDVAIALAGAWSRSDYATCREELLAGYRCEKPMSEAEVLSLPYLMALRAASLIAEAAQQPVGATNRDRIPGQIDRLRSYLSSRRAG